MSRLFLKGPDGRRPTHGESQKFQEDPHWRDLVLFYEYFHGDNGAGLGASHQTGWTGIVARMMHLFATTTAEQLLERGRVAPSVEVTEAARKADRQHDRPTEDSAKSERAHAEARPPAKREARR